MNPKSTPVKYGKKVWVYRNLRKNCLSVLDPKTRKVIGHTHKIFLLDVTFRVNEAGRQRVLKERRKNVHAFVVGTVCLKLRKSSLIRLYYNPYKSYGFEQDRGNFAGCTRSWAHYAEVYANPELGIKATDV